MGGSLGREQGRLTQSGAGAGSPDPVALFACQHQAIQTLIPNHDTSSPFTHRRAWRTCTPWASCTAILNPATCCSRVCAWTDAASPSASLILDSRRGRACWVSVVGVRLTTKRGGSVWAILLGRQQWGCGNFGRYEAIKKKGTCLLPGYV